MDPKRGRSEGSKDDPDKKYELFSRDVCALEHADSNLLQKAMMCKAHERQ